MSNRGSDLMSSSEAGAKFGNLTEPTNTVADESKRLVISIFIVNGIFICLCFLLLLFLRLLKSTEFGRLYLGRYQSSRTTEQSRRGRYGCRSHSIDGRDSKNGDSDKTSAKAGEEEYPNPNDQPFDMHVLENEEEDMSSESYPVKAIYKDGTNSENNLQFVETTLRKV